MIRVLVVDDLKLICEGLKAMFLEEADIDIVGFAHNGKEAIEKIIQLKPNVVLIDVLMPVMGGIETTKEIAKLFPDVKVIVLSTFEDDPIIIEAIAAGAKGYLLKNMVVEDLASAIRSVDRGSSHFAPGIIDSLAKTVIQNSNYTQSNRPQKVCTIDSAEGNNKPAVKTSHQAKGVRAKAKVKPDKPLFRYGDWIAVILGVIVLSQTNGMGHHLGHAGLFFLMLALIARPIGLIWDAPLKHRRAIGIFAFAATLAHAIYATIHILNNHFESIFVMPPQHQLGMWTGIISFSLMIPATVTSFQFWQRKLGKKWRQIHLLTVPALGFAILHTVLLGPNYMADTNIGILNYICTLGVVAAGLVVLLIRKRT